MMNLLKLALLLFLGDVLFGACCAEVFGDDDLEHLAYQTKCSTTYHGENSLSAGLYTNELYAYELPPALNFRFEVLEPLKSRWFIKYIKVEREDDVTSRLTLQETHVNDQRRNPFNIVFNVDPAARYLVLAFFGSDVPQSESQADEDSSLIIYGKGVLVTDRSAITNAPSEAAAREWFPEDEPAMSMKLVPKCQHCQDCAAGRNKGACLCEFCECPGCVCEVKQ